MGSLVSRIKSFFKGLWTGSSSHREMAALLQYGTGLGTFSGAWTDSRIELVRHFRHWVYIAIDRIATKVATQVPNVTHVVSRNKNKSKHAADEKRYRKRQPCLSAYARSKALTPLRSHEDLQPVDDDHPLLRLLHDPNEPDTAYDLWYETVLFLYLTGSTYWWIPRHPVTGLPEAIWVLPSHWVWPVVGKDRTIDGYEVRPVEGNYLRKFLPYEEVLHFKRKSPVSKIDGYSPQTAVNHWIDTQESVDRSRFFFFRNGTFPTVSVEFSGDLQDIGKEKLDQIEAKFMNRYQGETRTNKPLFVPPGMKVRPLFITPMEMGFVESAEQLRDNILAAFGVPAVVAQITAQMTYGSVAAAQAGFFTMTINPLLRFLGQQITEKLAWVYDDTLRVWWEDTTPDDPEMIEKRIQTDLLAGAITPNEVRALRGRAAYKGGGDDPLVAKNLAVMPIGLGTSPKLSSDSSDEDENDASNSSNESTLSGVAAS